MIDNILSFSLSILGVEVSLSLCWVSIAVGLEHSYGAGASWEWGLGKIYAWRPDRFDDFPPSATGPRHQKP